MVEQEKSTSKKTSRPAKADGALRATELMRVATGVTGALAAYEKISAQQRTILDSIRPDHNALGLAAQAAKASPLGAFVSPSVMSAATLSPALTFFANQISTVGLNPAHAAMAKSAAGIDTSPALKSLMSAIGPVANYSAADHLRPLFAGAGGSAGTASTWLAAMPNMGISSAAMGYGPAASVLDAIRPISALLKGVDGSAGLAKIILGLGATNDALDRISGLASAHTAIASIAGLVKPYQLPNVGLMANLAATRALFETVTPITKPVDRIGRGWASLGDRVVRGHLALAPLVPKSNLLAVKAYRLDIATYEDELDEDEELFDTRRDGIDPAAEWLAQISMSLCDRWNGMWDRMSQRGPDWRSQAANSAVELMIGLLNQLAPDDVVREWQIVSGKHTNPRLYLKDGTRGPTRRLKLFYIGDQYRVSRLTVEALFMAVPDTIDKILQGVKHGSTSIEELETAVSLIGEVVAILVPNRRR